MDYNEYYGVCWLFILISILKYGLVWKVCLYGYVDLMGILIFVYFNLEFICIVKGKDCGYFVCFFWYLKIIFYENL